MNREFTTEEERSKLSIQFSVAADITLKAGHWIKPRKLLDYELVYFPRGSNTEYISQSAGSYVLKEPCILITRPQELHEYRFDSVHPTRHLFVHFDGLPPFEECFPRLADAAQNPVVYLPEHSLIPQLMQQILFYFHKRPSRWRSLTKAMFLSVLEEAEALAGDQYILNNPPMPRQIVAALEHLEVHLSENIEVGTLAQVSGWSHEHFTRSFQQIVGYSPKEWMNKRKMERAGQLLLQSTDSIKMIAHELGFNDEYYFYRLFRRWMGMPASQYRNRYSDPRLQIMIPADEWSHFYPANHVFVLSSERR